jgi:hypothetical protein
VIERLRFLALVLAAALVLSLFPAFPARGAEVHFRLVGVQIREDGIWEEPAIKSSGSQPNTSDVRVEVDVNSLKRMKLGIYDQVHDTWVRTTVVEPNNYGLHTWTPTIDIPFETMSMGVYVYYWDSSPGVWVQDDVAFGWTPVHRQLIDTSPTWGPNQFSLPTNERSGDFATYQQYIWYWDNSVYTSQDVGTTHRNRLVNWANNSDSWLWTMEYRRISAPGGSTNKEGWNFAQIGCNGTCITGYYDWDSDIVGLRVGDVEELQLGGDEEAQWELDDEDVGFNFGVVVAREPEVRYGNMHHIRAVFFRRSGYKGDSVYVQTRLDEQNLCCLQPPESRSSDSLGHLRTSF